MSQPLTKIVNGVVIRLTEKEILARQDTCDIASSVFESLPIGKQALWQPVRAAVADAILSGDMEKAKEILVTVPALYADAEEDRAKFLALFP